MEIKFWEKNVPLPKGKEDIFMRKEFYEDISNHMYGLRR